ncbi:Sodium/hydrogen exchanger 7 [Sesamum angolense]|uniref:Sodium/hydrogen exchanger 7 n=1 Tax=Sesamum angolense TaxID=2727404 RepID=A0AAE1WUW5_9LAMI|nr:Sodium/hydrogen exchanger 7 [Sesamum angolense]
MLNKALEAFGDLGDDEELGPADWPTVKRYIKSLNDVDSEQVHPHSSSANDDNLDNMNLKDIRVRFLNGFGFRPDIKHKIVPSQTSEPEALEHAQGSRKLFEINCSQIPKLRAAYWIMLDEGRINQTTANLLMQSVDEAIDLVSDEALCDWKGLKSYVNIPNHYKFLQSSIVPQKLVTYFTVERLESACYICAAFLRAHRIARQQLHDFIGDSEIAAMVIRESEQEGEEPRAFLEDVRVTFPQTDLKRLLRNPPLVKIPKIRDLISANPLLGALPASARETLVGTTKEIMKLSGATLYREGSKPAGIWLISNGVVKWSRKNMSNKHLLHPTFTHGSTLETEKIFSALRSDPAVEDFFWRESIIILAKLMLPHIFEKMAMQDIRTLIAERSTMNIYIRGESFELLHHSVGLLLEGFIKVQGGQEELLTAPAAILPRVDQSFRQSGTLGSFSQQVSLYQVETRARVIIFEIAGFETGRTLQKRSSSLISHSADHPSGPLADEQGNNLSARALQLSIYGSMVNIGGRRTRSFPRSRRAKPSQSLSYPRVPSGHAPAMVSVKSEGSTTLRKKLHMHESEPESNLMQHEELHLNESRATRDESSDDSGCEDEHIVRIDSPSRLSFRQAP